MKQKNHYKKNNKPEAEILVNTVQEFAPIESSLEMVKSIISRNMPTGNKPPLLNKMWDRVGLVKSAFSIIPAVS